MGLIPRGLMGVEAVGLVKLVPIDARFGIDPPGTAF